MASLKLITISFLVIVLTIQTQTCNCEVRGLGAFSDQKSILANSRVLRYTGHAPVAYVPICGLCHAATAYNVPHNCGAQGYHGNSLEQSSIGSHNLNRGSYERQYVTYGLSHNVEHQDLGHNYLHQASHQTQELGNSFHPQTQDDHHKTLQTHSSQHQTSHPITQSVHQETLVSSPNLGLTSHNQELSHKNVATSYGGFHEQTQDLSHGLSHYGGSENSNHHQEVNHNGGGGGHGHESNSYQTINLHNSGGGEGSHHDHQEESHHKKDHNIHYKFEYGVNDHKTGDIKHQKEERKGDVVQGEYSLHEEGGNVRTVKYYADWKTGFHAQVHNTKEKKLG